MKPTEVTMGMQALYYPNGKMIGIGGEEVTIRSIPWKSFEGVDLVFVLGRSVGVRVSNLEKVEGDG